MDEISSAGEMLWKLEDGERSLHLRHNPSEPWLPYEDFPQYFHPDPEGFSKGITTFLSLAKQNWTTIKS